MSGAEPTGSRSLSLAILEVPFRVDFGPGLSDEDVARSRTNTADYVRKAERYLRELERVK